MNVGLIGCGFIGKKHAKSIASAHDIRLRAVCDTETDRAAELRRYYASLTQDPLEIESYQFYESLLENPQLDTIAITVPSGLHYRIAREALLRGKHVVLEKPMTLSLIEARSLIQIAETRQRKLIVCHQKRFFPHLRSIKGLMDRRGLGRVVTASLSLMYNRNDNYYNQSAWRGTWKMDGGVLLNQAIHDIDILLWLTGQPRTVQGFVERLIRPIEAEDTAAAAIVLENGTLLTIDATVCATEGTSREAVAVTGSAGAFVLEGKNLKPTYWNVPGVEEPVVSAVDPYAQLYQDVHDSIYNNCPPLVEAVEAVTALETIFAIYRSSVLEKAVTLPLNTMSTLIMKDKLQRRAAVRCQGPKVT
ncbi:Gfo/Idh/MocA family protein [Alicyclobacillus sp. SO9]|uniref:Gfo/Idh/MocA family protein n=1 Tax=Alicyclobacillus sp. SO9 TaxID=2665646 RepID=UPI0018E88E86|nr:Gfo/Idh/MocA family oxidoreductase [Alicyclobacillus sp. SO9]QQE80313.1 Gfo/Idh/MocA family oxidoreductase [Alicyclobacillus sp. SO9]